jgi:hypothetical protein
MCRPRDPAYGAYLNWLHMSDATLTFPQTLVLRYGRFEPAERQQPQVVQDYTRWFLARLRAVEAAVAQSEYLCAGRFTAADVAVGYALLLAQHLGLAPQFGPRFDLKSSAHAARSELVPSFCGQVCAGLPGQAARAPSGAACDAVPAKQAAPILRPAAPIQPVASNAASSPIWPSSRVAPAACSALACAGTGHRAQTVAPAATPAVDAGGRVLDHQAARTRERPGGRRRPGTRRARAWSVASHAR